MFNKLKGGIDAVKGAMDGGMMAQVINTITPHVQPHLDKVLDMNADAVQNDDEFKSTIVSPALVAVSAASSGSTSLIPRFEERFNIAMLHIRDELVVCEDGKVSLANDSQSRLPSVLEESFKKSA